MTGDEREPDNDVGQPTESNPPAPQPAEDAARPRPFRSWASAQQEEGVLEKIGKRISGMFARKSKEVDDVDDTSQDGELELILPDESPAETPAEPGTVALDVSMILKSAAPEPEALIDASAAQEHVEEFAPEVAAQPDVPTIEPEPASEPAVMWTPDYTPPVEKPTPIDTPVVESAPAAEMEPAIDAMGDEPITEPMLPPAVAAKPKRGLFATLFGRKPKPVEAQVAAPLETPVEATVEPAVEPTVEPAEEPTVEPPRKSIEVPLSEIRMSWEENEELIRTDEHEVPAPEEIAVAEQTFDSVEEALPSDESLDVADFADSADEALVEEQPRKGFFSRLFARKSKPAVRPSLEIEVHEDRIEAAAHALDEVSGESFAAATGASDEEVETFASVEDALPTEPVESVEPELEEPVPTVDELRFAPPAPEPQPAIDARSTLEIEPFDPFASTTDERDTVETTADSRSTLEMEQHEQREARSTEEIALDDELGIGKQDFSDTLEIDEKTDEFAIPDVDTERDTDEVELDESDETAEVAKQTWWAKLLGIKPKVVAKKALPAGTVVEGNPNFLFSKFRAFYNEIIRLKHQKSEFTAGFATAIVTDYTADLSPDAAAASQSQALMQMLELQLAEANWMGGEARDRYPDAQYAMACLADEIFLHVEWDGQTAWRNHLLEVKLFRSRAADVELFKRIDKLLKDRPNSHVARDLARVYLLVLAAGFQGKYRPFGLTRALAEYRQRLFEYIHQGDALMLYAPERRIFPEASSHTREGHAVSRFSGAQRWAAILILMVLGYTALAHYAWNRVSADLKDVTERIKAASSTSAAPASGTTTANTARNGGGQ